MSRFTALVQLEFWGKLKGVRPKVTVPTMPKASEEHLLLAYKQQIDWLLALADEFESGARRIMGQVGGNEVDLTPNLAAECRHRAGNMEAVLEVYRRLHAKAT